MIEAVGCSNKIFTSTPTSPRRENAPVIPPKIVDQTAYQIWASMKYTCHCYIKNHGNVSGTK